MKASAMTTENATNKIFFVLSNKEYYHWYFKDLVLSATRRLKELINWIIWNHDSKDHKLTSTLMQPPAKIIESLYFSSKGDKDTEMMKIRRNCWQLRWKKLAISKPTDVSEGFLAGKEVPIIQEPRGYLFFSSLISDIF